MSDSFQSICQQFPWTSDVHSDETFSTETVHRTGIDHQPMFFNLTFTMRSLKLRLQRYGSIITSRLR